MPHTQTSEAGRFCSRPPHEGSSVRTHSAFNRGVTPLHRSSPCRPWPSVGCALDWFPVPSSKGHRTLRPRLPSSSLLVLNHIPSANPWPAYDQVFHDSNLIFRCPARPRQWWLILFSLDAEARPCDNGLAAAHRSRRGHLWCGSVGCDRVADGGDWRAPLGDTPGVHDCYGWLRVPLPGVSAIHGARLGTPGCACRDLLYYWRSHYRHLSYRLSAWAAVFVHLFRSPVPHRRLFVRLFSHTTCFFCSGASSS